MTAPSCCAEGTCVDMATAGCDTSSGTNEPPTRRLTETNGTNSTTENSTNETANTTANTTGE